MGVIDCLTTVVGVQYFGAAELNPLIAGIVSTNIPVFIAIKVAATIFIGLTYFAANKTLNFMDKSSKSFIHSDKMLKIVYTGLVLLLGIVVLNNLLILIT